MKYHMNELDKSIPKPNRSSAYLNVLQEIRLVETLRVDRFCSYL